MSTKHIGQMSTTRTGGHSAKNARRSGPPTHQQANGETPMMLDALSTEPLWAAMYDEERAKHRVTVDWAGGLSLDNVHLRYELHKTRLQRAALWTLLREQTRTVRALRIEIDNLATECATHEDAIAELLHEIDGGNH